MTTDGYRLYDLLGVASDAEAAAFWPGDKFTMVEGYNVVDDALACISALNLGVSFTALRVGSDPDVQVGTAASPGLGLAGQITFSANAEVLGDIGPYYARDLPNLGILLLQSAAGKAPTAYFARDGRGYEVLIEGLSVELQFPTGLLTPSKDGDDHDGDVTPFSPGDDDSVQVLKVRGAPSVIRTHIRLHLTPDGDVLIEPNTPLSIDSAKFSNLPVTALHDVLFIPSPRRRDLYEWARNDLISLLPGPPGMFGFRSILFDLGKPPFSDLVKRFQDSTSGVQAANVDLVLEDVVIPASGFGFPLPTHGTFGIRRKITDRASIEQAYSLTQAPFRARLYSRDGQADADHSGLYLVVNQLEFRTGSFAAASEYPPVLEFQAQLDWQNASNADGAKGATIGVSDDWVVQLGLALGADSPLHIMTVASADIAINAVKGGLRLTTFADDLDHSWQVVVDLSARDTSVAPPPDAKPSAFKITTLTGKPLNVILRDVGWSFGQLQLGQSIAAPEGVQLVFACVVRLIVEELGFVEEPAGGTYFSFSGGVLLGASGGKASPPASTRTDNDGTGGGIRFRRLRFLTSDTPSAAPWKLDGILLDIHYGPVAISGFGYISDDVVSGYRYQEFGFGAQVAFPLGTHNLKIAAEFLKGVSTEIAAPNSRFSYLLASLEVSWVPAGPVALYAVRALFAYNMQPALDPAGTGPQSMQLYQWHKDHDGALDMPRSRNLADWTPVNNAIAVGVAAGVSFTSTGQLFHVGVFVLVTLSETDTGVLVVGDVYLLKNPDSIGFLAFDYDDATSTWGVMIGVNLGLDKFVGGTIPAWIANLAKLTGTLFFGNNPGTFAIGQLSDQRSWMGITLSASWLSLKVRIAICVQIVDGGPKGFGAVASFTGGADWGIGKFQVYGSLGFIWGPWKTGSDANAFHLSAQAGFKMSVFYVFSIGMEIDFDVVCFTSPRHHTLTAQIHIDTPWFLPDVSFQITTSSGQSQPFDAPLVTPPLSAAAASPPAGGAPVAMFTPALSDGVTDPTTLYSHNQLAAVSPISVAGVKLPDSLTPVAVDADLSVTFSSPLSNDAGIATQSYPVTADPGAQKVQDLTVRYALKSVQILRSPRFGPQAGVWTDLVAVADTALDTGGSIHAAPAVSFAWDADTRADGVVSPSRLFINCRTPYSFVGSSQNDEEALGNDDGFPCCHLDPIKGFQIPWHDLSWSAAQPGLRLPTSEAFSENGGLWSWTAPPATTKGVGDYAGRIVAVVLLDASTVLGSVELADPAVTFKAQLLPMSSRITCVLTAYHGLDLLTRQTIVGGAPATTVSLAGTTTKPITRVTLEAAIAAASPQIVVENPWGALGAPAVMVYDLQYTSLADVLSVMARRQRCSNGGATSGVGGAGKLAFMPNYNYAIVPNVEVTVSHVTDGAKSLTLAQPTFFRTKGLIGLNASPNVGDELAPYVASTYPPNRSVPLYRSEPVALAFTEGMSSLLPVDRVAAVGDPPEKAQLMPLALSVDRVASTDGAVRLTAPGDDWLTVHSGAVVVGRPPFRNGLFSTLATRKAASNDPQVLRFEAVLGAAGCSANAPHASQVLSHAALALDGAAGAWPAQAAMRATVRAQDGPFTERAAFVANDLGAFSYLSDGGASPVWSLANGALLGPGSGRQYAAFGDPTWNHFQIGVTVAPAGGVAGIGIGLSGATPVQQGLLALVDGGDLVLVRRLNGVDQESARAALPAATTPLQLHVTAFDDIVRASIGDVVLEADRGAVREGRAALVADGAAIFSALLVESLDMYRVEFVTSRYLSFAEHIAQRDTSIYAHTADAMGAAAASTPSAVLAARSAEIAAAMSPAADPQLRQQLFTQLLSDVGLAKLHVCNRLTLTRLTGPAGVSALLFDSPEPLSFLHDVTATLLQSVLQRLPHPTAIGSPNPITAALSQLAFVNNGIVAPAAAAHTLYAAKVQVLLVTAAAPAFSMQEFSVPAPSLLGSVPLHRIRVLDAAGAQAAGLGALVSQPLGVLLAVRADHTIAGAVRWLAKVEVPVAMTLIGNADETSTLMLLPSSLGPGVYALRLAFSRTRWTTTTADPASLYQDSATMELSW